MANDSKKFDKEAPAPSGAGARRIGRIVHDDRGNAKLEWQAVPDDRSVRLDRIELTLKDETGRQPKLALEDYRRSSGTNPYDRVASAGATDPDATLPRSSNTRRDLRKLSEWIKLKRELDDRKTDDGDTEE